MISAQPTVSNRIPTTPSCSTGQPSPIDERYLRNATLIDQQKINEFPAAIIGIGAIGSHLAEMLAKMGVKHFTLIDPDVVDTVNLGVQGFYYGDVGQSKVDAVAARLAGINTDVEVKTFMEEFKPEMIPGGAYVFSCVDSIKVRRFIFKHFRIGPWSALFDGRMSAESLRAFTIDREPESLRLYHKSLFPSGEAYREGCTAKATIYCASLAAAILCAQFKKLVMNQLPEPHIQFDIFGMDCFR